MMPSVGIYENPMMRGTHNCFNLSLSVAAQGAVPDSAPASAKARRHCCLLREDTVLLASGEHSAGLRRASPLLYATQQSDQTRATKRKL